ncbi:MAG: 4-hydroxy-3-methylbut-2-enyl diphosphate reductase [Candidatus Omnitrophota bacterium]|nr:4-hydroxy-3-methylbut-2-enyl diphosphate reductase [Candidatus Omnitrophota bacterium]
MKINLAKSAGFCFGVKRALEIAYKTISSGSKVYMLGDIVHNEQVIKEIQQAGIKKIIKLKQGKNKTLLIRAHGASINTFNRALSLGYKIVDATCPMVKEIHKIAKDLEQKGYTIIVMGDKKHEEVQGIIGQLKNKALVIESFENIPYEKLKKIKKAAVVVQSTQNMENTLKIVAILKQQIKELKFFNTICLPTRTKQGEIKLMPLENDVMIIIGSKTSANTKRLYEISKSLNKHSYWVQSKKEIKPLWFKDAQGIGITAGASTPDSTTKEIVEYISSMTI